MLRVEGLDKFQKKIKNIQSLYNGTKIENEIGKEFKRLVQKTFEDKRSPFGKSWIPSKNNPDTLIDTGALLDSVSYKAMKNKVVVFAGSGLEYARFHNNGTDILPKRQFLPNEGKIPAKWREQAISIIQNELRKEL